MKIENVETIEDLYNFCKELKKQNNGNKKGFYNFGDYNLKKEFKDNKGVYIFFDSDEKIDKSLIGEEFPRIVRIGTVTSRSLVCRLEEHRGNKKEIRGDHRASVFRKLVGLAFIDKNDFKGYPYWGIGNSKGDALKKLKKVGFNSSKDIFENERPLERMVSVYIRKLPFLVIYENEYKKRMDLEDKLIEIAAKSVLEGKIKVSEHWLGNFLDKDEVTKSGLWNVDEVRKIFKKTHLTPASAEKTKTQKKGKK